VVACSVGAAALVLAAAVPASASGGASDPPGWAGGTTPGEWVAFTVGPSAGGPVDRNGTRVTITRNALQLTTPLTTAFAGWMQDTDGDANTPAAFGWPDVWSDNNGSATLQRVAWCDGTVDQCDYQVSVPGPFHFAAGVPPIDPDSGLPNEAPFVALFAQFAGVVQPGVPLELTIVFGWDPASATTPANGTTPGRLTLDASGSSDQFPGSLEFIWTVTRASDGRQFPGTGPVAQFDLDADATYCVSLTVTNTADSFSRSYGVDAPDCQPVTGVAPQAPAPSGGGVSPGVGSGIGAIPTLVDAGAPTVVFAPPRATRSSLTGSGQRVDSSVLWLWRPEWYQSSSETQTLPQTGGAPRLKGRADIVVSGEKAPDSNAAPWLAGLGAFGLIGIGWVLNKRRQVRAEY
jgi:hypothetical protein